MSRDVISYVCGNPASGFNSELFMQFNASRLAAMSACHDGGRASASERVDYYASLGRERFDEELCESFGHWSGVCDTTMLVVGLADGDDVSRVCPTMPVGGNPVSSESCQHDARFG